MVLPMIDTNGTLRHRAFFDVLATTDEASDAWRAARAGLVALRLLDAWSEYGNGAQSSLATLRAQEKAFKYEVDAVQSVIAELPTKGAERRLLSSIVARIVDAHDGEPSRLVAPLFAYARALHVRSAYLLAADVYAIVWEAHIGDSAIGVVDGEVATAAALYLGVCYRTVGDAERAAQAFRAAGTLAAVRGDERSVLRARLGEAKISAGLGQLKLAHESLSWIIGAATGADCIEVRAFAWHDLAIVARQLGHHDEALNYAHEAWTATADAVERERVLITLATLLLEAGYADIARDANALLADTAREPVTRWAATINLVEIASLERRELDFMRYRRALAGIALPPALATDFEYFVGQGHLAFGQPTLAAAAFDRAVTVAQRHGLAEPAQRAEVARAALGAGRALTPPRFTSVTPRPARVNRIAESIHGARLLATASG
jgi:tetratricopeptide (TPR) repeat protein